MSLRLVPAPTAPDAADGVRGVVVCLVCRVGFDRFARAGEPSCFAAVRNRRHHGAHPVAFVTDVEAAGPFGGEAA
jgi:hypothetical protein